MFWQLVAAVAVVQMVDLAVAVEKFVVAHRSLFRVAGQLTSRWERVETGALGYQEVRLEKTELVHRSLAQASALLQMEARVVVVGKRR